MPSKNDSVNVSYIPLLDVDHSTPIDYAPHILRTIQEGVGLIRYIFTYGGGKIVLCLNRARDIYDHMDKWCDGDIENTMVINAENGDNRFSLCIFPVQVNIGEDIVVPLRYQSTKGHEAPELGQKVKVGIADSSGLPQKYLMPSDIYWLGNLRTSSVKFDGESVQSKILSLLRDVGGDTSERGTNDG